MGTTARQLTAGQRLEAMERRVPSGPEDPGDEAVRLRADIAQTRAEIGTTISAIQEKLSPAVLAEQAKTAVREATIGKVESMVEHVESTMIDTGHSLTDTVRRHPLSATLAGVGLFWLWMNRRRDAREVRERYGDRESGPGALRSAAGDVMHRAQDMAERAQESIGEATHDAGKTMKGLARAAKDTSIRAEHRAEDAYYDNPLAAGAFVLAAGTALGLAIPITRREDRWMGKARDQVVDKVNEMAQEAMTEVKEAAPPA